METAVAMDTVVDMELAYLRGCMDDVARVASGLLRSQSILLKEEERNKRNRDELPEFNFIGRRSINDGIVTKNFDAQDRFVKTNTPAYSMPKSKRDTITGGGGAGRKGNSDYMPTTVSNEMAMNANANSKYKRAKSAIIMGANTANASLTTAASRGSNLVFGGVDDNAPRFVSSPSPFSEGRLGVGGVGGGGKQVNNMMVSHKKGLSFGGANQRMVKAKTITTISTTTTPATTTYTTTNQNSKTSKYSRASDSKEKSANEESVESAFRLFFSYTTCVPCEGSTYTNSNSNTNADMMPKPRSREEVVEGNYFSEPVKYSILTLLGDDNSNLEDNCNNNNNSNTSNINNNNIININNNNNNNIANDGDNDEYDYKDDFEVGDINHEGYQGHEESNESPFNNVNRDNAIPDNANRVVDCTDAIAISGVKADHLDSGGYMTTNREEDYYRAEAEREEGEYYKEEVESIGAMMDGLEEPNIDTDDPDNNNNDSYDNATATATATSASNSKDSDGDSVHLRPHLPADADDLKQYFINKYQQHTSLNPIDANKHQMTRTDGRNNRSRSNRHNIISNSIIGASSGSNSDSAYNKHDGGAINDNNDNLNDEDYNVGHHRDRHGNANDNSDPLSSAISITNGTSSSSSSASSSSSSFSAASSNNSRNKAILSHQVSVQAAKWGPDPALRPPTKYQYYHEFNKPKVIGPGHYDVSYDPDNKLTTRAGKNSSFFASKTGRIHGAPNHNQGIEDIKNAPRSFPSSAATSTAANANTNANTNTNDRSNFGRISLSSSSNTMSSASGPGYYDVSKADNLTRHSAAKSISLYRPDSKPTIQMQLKQYWEEKARDARDFHDDQVLANDSFIRKRSVVAIIPDPKSVIESDERLLRVAENRRVMMEEKHMETVAATTAAEGSSEASMMMSESRNLVERRSVSLVSMGVGERALKQKEDLLASKPMLAKVLADKHADSLGPAAGFYGPQLQVPWVVAENAKSALNNRGKSGGIYDYNDYDNGHDDGEDDAFEREKYIDNEIDDLKHILGMTRGKPKAKDSDTASAYLRSSLSGAMKKKTVMMIDSPDRGSRKSMLNESEVRDEERRREDYIGPQLPVDWVSKLNSREMSHKNKALNMELSRGRDSIHIDKKGSAKVLEFNDHKMEGDGYGGDENLEAAYYSTPLPQFGANVKGAVKIDKVTSRADAAGPFGEKPEASKQALADLLDDPLFESDKDGRAKGYGLDLDVIGAFDAIRPNKSKEVPLLYRRERYEKEWDDGLGDGIHPEHPDKVDHLGGSWFKGMAEDIISNGNNRRGNHLRFDKQIGRDDGNDDIEERLLEQELAEALPGNKGRGGNYNLDLDPKWDKFIDNTGNAAVRMKDPEKYPRFEDNLKLIEAAQLEPLEPKFDFIRKKETFLVNMDKMISRPGLTDLEEEKLVDVEVDGIVDSETALDLATQREDRITRATDDLKKKVPFYVDMDKQKGELNRNLGVKDLSQRPEYEIYSAKDNIGGDVKGGVKDWSKEVGREEGDLAKGNLLDIPGLTREEREVLGLMDYRQLILDPSTGRDMLSTTNEGGKSFVPAWKVTENIPRFQMSKPVPPSDLDFADIDPHKFKKGLHAIDASKHTASMMKSQGRAMEKEAEDKIFYSADGNLGLEPEVLDLDPRTAEEKLLSRKDANYGALLGKERQNFPRKIPEKEKVVRVFASGNKSNLLDTVAEEDGDLLLLPPPKKDTLRSSFNTDIGAKLERNKEGGNVKTSYLASSTGRLSVDDENKIIYKELGPEFQPEVLQINAKDSESFKGRELAGSRSSSYGELYRSNSRSNTINTVNSNSNSNSRSSLNKSNSNNFRAETLNLNASNEILATTDALNPVTNPNPNPNPNPNLSRTRVSFGDLDGPISTIDKNSSSSSIKQEVSSAAVSSNKIDPMHSIAAELDELLNFSSGKSSSFPTAAATPIDGGSGGVDDVAPEKISFSKGGVRKSSRDLSHKGEDSATSNSNSNSNTNSSNSNSNSAPRKASNELTIEVKANDTLINNANTSFEALSKEEKEGDIDMYGDALTPVALRIDGPDARAPPNLRKEKEDRTRAGGGAGVVGAGVVGKGRESKASRK